MSIIADDNDFEKPKIEKKNPVVKPEAVDCDKNFENCIRPKSFDTYIGQSALKDNQSRTKKRKAIRPLAFLWTSRVRENHSCWGYCPRNGS